MWLLWRSSDISDDENSNIAFHLQRKKIIHLFLHVFLIFAYKIYHKFSFYIVLSIQCELSLMRIWINEYYDDQYSIQKEEIKTSINESSLFLLVSFQFHAIFMWICNMLQTHNLNSLFINNTHLYISISYSQNGKFIYYFFLISERN